MFSPQYLARIKDNVKQICHCNYPGMTLIIINPVIRYLIQVINNKQFYYLQQQCASEKETTLFLIIFRIVFNPLQRKM